MNMVPNAWVLRNLGLINMFKNLDEIQYVNQSFVPETLCVNQSFVPETLYVNLTASSLPS